MPEVTAERAPVFPGGLAILAELFEALEIEQMRVADGALREGLLYDMIGRFTDEDARARTVRAMQQRYHVDVAQAERVEATALDFLRQVRQSWGLTIRSPSLRCAGRPLCTRSASTCRTRTIRSTVPTCSSTPTCLDFRARNRCCWRRWSGAHRRKIVMVEDLTS